MRQQEPPRVQAARLRGDQVLKVNGRHYKIIAAADGAPNTQIKPLGFWMKVWAFIVGSTLIGCGGAAFVYGIPDAGPEASDPSADAQPEVDSPLGHPNPEADAGLNAGPDAGLDAEAPNPDSSQPPIEAGLDVGVTPIEAGGPDAGSCTHIPTVTKICGSNNQLIEAPAQWCWITGFGSQAPQGNLESTSPRCQCLETYDCACVLSEFKFPSCGGVGDPVTARCTDAAGYPVVECP